MICAMILEIGNNVTISYGVYMACHAMEKIRGITDWLLEMAHISA